jgi:hypothetical protein
MANEEQLAILKSGVEAWNSWRKTHRQWVVILSEAHLREAKLSKAKLSRAILNKANLIGADLREADLRGQSLVKRTSWRRISAGGSSARRPSSRRTSPGRTSAVPARPAQDQALVAVVRNAQRLRVPQPTHGASVSNVAPVRRLPTGNRDRPLRIAAALTWLRTSRASLDRRTVVPDARVQLAARSAHLPAGPVLGVESPRRTTGRRRHRCSRRPGRRMPTRHTPSRCCAHIARLWLVPHPHLAPTASAGGQVNQQSDSVARSTAGEEIVLMSVVGEASLVGHVLLPNGVLTIHRFSLTRWLRLPERRSGHR